MRAADGSARGSYSRDRPALPPASDKAYRPPGTPPPLHPPLPLQRERANAKPTPAGPPPGFVLRYPPHTLRRLRVWKGRASGAGQRLGRVAGSESARGGAGGQGLLPSPA